MIKFYILPDFPLGSFVSLVASFAAVAAAATAAIAVGGAITVEPLAEF